MQITRTKKALAAVVALVLIGIFVALAAVCLPGDESVLPSMDNTVADTGSGEGVLSTATASATAPSEDGKVPDGYQPSGTGITDIATARGDLDGEYYLTQDITINSLAVATGDETNIFTGVFDGNGKTITIDVTQERYTDGNFGGLFAILQGTVKNCVIVVENFQIRLGSGSSWANAGMVAGAGAEGSYVENVKVVLEYSPDTVGNGSSDFYINQYGGQSKKGSSMKLGGVFGNIIGKATVVDSTVDIQTTGNYGFSTYGWRESGGWASHSDGFIYIGGFFGNIQSGSISANRLTLAGTSSSKIHSYNESEGSYRYNQALIGGVLGYADAGKMDIDGLIITYPLNGNLGSTNATYNCTYGIINGHTNSAGKGGLIANAYCLDGVQSAYGNSGGGQSLTAYFSTFASGITPVFVGTSEIAFNGFTKQAPSNASAIVAEITQGGTTQNVMQALIATSESEAGQSVWLTVPYVNATLTAAISLAASYATGSTIALSSDLTFSSGEGIYMASREYNGENVSASIVLGDGRTDLYYSEANANKHVGTHTLTSDIASASGYAYIDYAGTKYVYNTANKTIYTPQQVAGAAFDVTKALSVEITQRAITLGNASGNITYGDTVETVQLNNIPEATSGSLVGGEYVESCTISDYVQFEINAGSEDAFTYTAVVIKDASGADVTANYNISYGEGTAVVKQKTIAGALSVADLVYANAEKVAVFTAEEGMGLFNDDAVEITYSGDRQNVTETGFTATATVPKYDGSNSNYTFEGGASISETFIITPYETTITVNEEATTEYDYSGVVPNSVLLTLFNAPEGLAGETLFLDFEAFFNGETATVNYAGTYTVRATLAESYVGEDEEIVSQANYTAASCDATITIKAKEINVSLSDVENSKTYDGVVVGDDYLQTMFVVDGEVAEGHVAELEITVAEGEIKNAGVYNISVALPSHYDKMYAISASSVTTTTYTVNKIVIDGAITLPENKVFDGNEKVATFAFAEGNLMIGEDEVSVSYSDAQGKVASVVDAGTYTVTATLPTFDGLNSNYEFAQTVDASVELVVSPLGVSIVAGDAVMRDYDKSEFVDYGSLFTAPKAVDGMTDLVLTYNVSGAGEHILNAGVYTVTAALEVSDANANYTAESASVTYTVNVRKVVAPTVTEGQSFVYNGGEQTLLFNEDENSKDYYVIEGNTATAANGYTATATLADTVNTTWADESTDAIAFVWSIARKSVEKPVGQAFAATGETITFITETDDYSVSGETSGTEINKYTVTVSLKDKANTMWADDTVDDQTITFEIIDATKVAVVYNAEELDSALAGDKAIIMLGADINYDKALTISRNVEIDLAGYALTVTSKAYKKKDGTYLNTITVAADVVIKGNGEIKAVCAKATSADDEQFSSTSARVTYVETGASLSLLDGVTYISENEACYPIEVAGTLVINGTTVKLRGASTYGAIYVNTNGAVVDVDKTDFYIEAESKTANIVKVNSGLTDADVDFDYVNVEAKDFNSDLTLFYIMSGTAHFDNITAVTDTKYAKTVRITSIEASSDENPTVLELTNSTFEINYTTQETTTKLGSVSPFYSKGGYNVQATYSGNEVNYNAGNVASSSYFYAFMVSKGQYNITNNKITAATYTGSTVSVIFANMNYVRNVAFVGNEISITNVDDYAKKGITFYSASWTSASTYGDSVFDIKGNTVTLEDTANVKLLNAKPTDVINITSDEQGKGNTFNLTATNNAGTFVFASSLTDKMTIESNVFNMNGFTARNILDISSAKGGVSADSVDAITGSSNTFSEEFTEGLVGIAYENTVTTTEGTTRYYYGKSGNVFTEFGADGVTQQVKLLVDLTTTVKFENVFGDITFDLNGQSITANEVFLGEPTYAILIDVTKAGHEININIINSAEDKVDLTVAEGTTYGYGIYVRYQGEPVDGDSLNVYMSNVRFIAPEYALGTNGTDYGASINATNCSFVGGNAGAYLPGEHTVTLTGCEVSGDTGIYVKSGTLTVQESTVIATGAYSAPVYNGSGFDASGSAIVADACNSMSTTGGGYRGNLNVSVANSTLESANGYGVELVGTNPNEGESGDDFANLTAIESVKNTFVTTEDKGFNGNMNEKVEEENVTVVKNDPVVNPVVALDGTLYTSSDMPEIATAEGDTAGTIKWVSAQLEAGTTLYTWEFTPADADNYETVTGTYELTVEEVKLASIDATINLNGDTVYSNDSVDDLRQYITVNGTNNDGSDYGAIEDFVLQGDLSEGGLCTITVVVNGTMSDTVTVDVEVWQIVSIAVTTQPDKAAYTAFDDFDKTGMEVTAYYNDGAETVVEGYAVENGTNLQAGTTSLKITYEGHETTVGITVAKYEVEVPQAASGLVYTGGEQTGVEEGEYYIVSGGKGTDATEYEATLSLTDPDNTAWKDGDSEDVVVIWSIAKAEIAPTVTVKDWTFANYTSDSAPVISGNPSDGVVTYVYSGTPNDGSEFVSGSQIPALAGSYKLTVTIAEGTNYLGATCDTTFTVGKATVLAPVIAAKAYTGDTLTADVDESPFYTVTENNGGEAVGEYDVELTLTDAYNYKWSDTEEATTVVKFNIVNQVNEWIAQPATEGWTYGENAKAPTFEAKFGNGTAIVEYRSADGSVYSDQVPSDAGNYVVRITVPGTSDYGVLVSEDVPFAIAKADYDMTGVTFADKTVTYNGKVQTIAVAGELPVGKDGVPVTVSYSDGVRNVGSVVITATFATESGNYNAPKDMTATLTVEAKELTLTNVKAVDREYNGFTSIYLTVGETLNGVVSGDDVKLYSYKGEVEDKNVGENKKVTVVVVLTGGDKDNYVVAQPENLTVTINPLQLEVKWGETTFVYNGKEQAPSASVVTGVIGESVSLNVRGAVNAGYHDAVATMAVANDNYTLTNATKEFFIEQLEIEKPVAASGLVYNSTVQTGVEEGKYYTVFGGKGTDAKNYTATVSLTDPENTKWKDGDSEDIVVNWSIAKAVYDMTGVTFEDAAFEYDGTVKSISISGDLPKGVTVTYLNNENVNAGKYDVVAYFVSEDAVNYEPIPDMTARVVINPKEVAVVWSDTQLIYNGEMQKPTASAIGVDGENVEIFVDGEQIEVGTYTATAICYDDNYTLTNETVQFTIKRSEVVAQFSVGYGEIFVVVDEIGDGVEYSVDGGEWATLPDDGKISVNLEASWTINLRYAGDVNYTSNVVYTTADNVVVYLDKNLSGDALANKTVIDTANAWLETATGDKTAAVGKLEKAQEDYEAAKNALTESVQDAFKVTAKLTTRALAAAVAITTAVTGLGIAVGAIALRRKGGKKNED